MMTVAVNWMLAANAIITKPHRYNPPGEAAVGNQLVKRGPQMLVYVGPMSHPACACTHKHAALTPAHLSGLVMIPLFEKRPPWQFRCSGVANMNGAFGIA
jgi:hypothetical protein